VTFLRITGEYFKPVKS